MEIIRKIINLQESKSFKSGLLPFIPFNGVFSGDTVPITVCENGITNYGGFVCDFSYDKVENLNDGTSVNKTIIVKYLDLVHLYNEVQKLIRNGIFLKKKENAINDGVNGYLPIDLNNDFSCTSGVIYDNKICVYNYTPYIKDDFIYNTPYYYSLNNEINDEYIILLSDFSELLNNINEIWNRLINGNEYISLFDFCKKFEQIIYGVDKCNESGFTIASLSSITPTIDIPILLDDNTLSDELYYTYEYTLSGTPTTINLNGENFSGINGEEITYYPYEDENVYEVKTFTDDILVDSKLSYLISEKAQYAADGIFGIYETFNSSGGCLFNCVFKKNTSSTPQCFSSAITITKYYSGETEDNLVEYSTYKNIVTGKTEEIAPIFNGNTGITGDRIVLPRKLTSNIHTTFTSGTSEWSLELNNIFYKTGETITNISAITYYNYEWWECIKETKDINQITCADGEEVKSGEAKYRNITLLSCIPSFVAEPKDGDFFYFLAKNDNGPIVTGNTIIDVGQPIVLRIPYEVGSFKNIVSIDENTKICDYIESTSVSGDFITILYRLGASLMKKNEEFILDNEHPGILYKEILKYSSGIKEKVFIDGIYEGELYYDKIDYEFTKKSFYNEIYKQTLYTNQANIVSMEVGCVDMMTTKDNSGKTIPLLITKDGGEGLQESPEYDINVIFNRGAGAAWEHHFKLSECNTIDDLKKYGNNYFNL